MNTFFQLFEAPPPVSALYAGQYSWPMMVLSVAIALFASYGALAAASRMAGAPSRAVRWRWIGIAALTMGLGTWAMHFIGMLSLNLPCGVSYEPFLTLVSMLPSVLVSGVAFSLLDQAAVDKRVLWLSSLLLGTGIGTMHYVGMAAMQLDGYVRYQPGLFGLSIVVAVSLAFLALWVKVSTPCNNRRCALVVAGILGLAVSGMHYTAMSAAYFVSGSPTQVHTSALGSTRLALFVAVVAALLALVALALTAISRNREISSQLLRSEQRWRSALEGAGDGVLEFDLPTGQLTFSPVACDIFGFDRADSTCPLAQWLQRIDPDERVAFTDKFTDFLRSKRKYYKTEVRIQRRAPVAWIWVEIHSMVLSRNALGSVEQLTGTVRDITQRKQDEERLQLAASVFTHAREGIMITDATGVIIDVNDTFCRITGYSSEQALGQNPRLLKSDRQTPEFYSVMWKALLGKGHWYGEVWNQHLNGEVYAVMQTISAVRNAQGQTQHYVCLFSDITPMKQHQQQLERVAHYDMLTNLPNRLLLADRLQLAMAQALRRQNILALVYLDLDGFKTINDSYGHDVGDEILTVLAHRMKNCLRDGDTLARVGGDEFVAVLVDLVQKQDFEPLLQRMLQAAARPVLVNTKAGQIALQVSASIGVTLYPQDNTDADLLMRQADQAMYVVKQSGKNNFHLFDLARDAAMQTQHESLECIRCAVERKEFVLYYQPKVNLRTGQVTGAEALIRWQHPERGLLAPAAFLPVIENHPISNAIGEWVITTALAQITAWHSAGLDLPVSVNIGGPQLQQDGFAARLAQLLLDYPEVQPEFLQLEVLESSALEDIVKVSAVMKACHAIGVAFALDDFGTGYSSLTYLKHLPAQTLKIDQSFVRDIISDPNDLAIVTGVIGLARVFERQVIAEGVETSAHGELLLSIGCELAQGYGIARPMLATNMPAWVKMWEASPVWTA